MHDNGKRVALVTGASSGIGKATAEALVKEGYVVNPVARRVEIMDDLKALGCTPIKMDVTKEEDVVAVVEQITRDHGGVDILVNNAGLPVYGSVEEIDIEKACVDGSCIARDFCGCDGLSVQSCVRPVCVAVATGPDEFRK
ncbi:SDR family NAD(P)-dependent oxidoreductase [uncultured Roseobacter sp.]|uniref:SDR family NAD(P)-dependent oxidoreductase n=1 Tax=uncultured Roseobacter sp. TaxID=114847 RepID=UPI002611750B|nr:SDR family NAD(P)-dependent oxidoreductase [uncultured Roseobacter sp.]